MGTRLIRISRPWLTRVLQGHSMSRVTTDLPDDAEVVGAFLDLDDNEFLAIKMQSESWGDTPYGTPYLYVTPTLTVTFKEDTGEG